jgi:hypothetical protein
MPTNTESQTADPTPAMDMATFRQMVDERVEHATARANRRVRVLSGLAILLGVLALGATGALAYYTYYHGMPGVVSPSIQTREVVLVDRAGVQRGYWRVDAEGTMRLALADPDGVERLRLTVRADGEQAIAIADGAGAARVALAVLQDNSANLAFADGRGQTRSVLGLTEAGAASLLFTDPMGGARAALGVGADGSPEFWWPELGNGGGATEP